MSGFTLRFGSFLFIGILLPVLVFAIYWPGLGGGFAFDDFPNIVNNTALHVTRAAWPEWLAAMLSSPATDLQRPLAMLSFAANHFFTGLDPSPMKASNIAIHAINSLLVFALVRQLVLSATRSLSDSGKKSRWIALFISLCWALHPINLMAILFIVQRMEILSHTFVFAGLWLYVLGRQRQIAGLSGWGRILTGLVPCTLLGILSKESAALLPLYALGVELCLFQFLGAAQTRDRRLYLLYVLVLVLPALVALAWLLPRSLSPGAYSTRNFSLAERLLTEPRVVLDYLRWILMPDLGQLSLYHDDYQPSRSLLQPPSTLFAMIALPVLIALGWLARVRRPLLSLGLFWFFAAQLLTATFIPLELVFEHRNYFASLGVCLVIADLLLIWPLRRSYRQLGLLFAILFLLYCAGVTHLRAREWSNPVQFSLSEAAKHPRSPRATYDMGRTLVILGAYRQDSPFTREAFEALDAARKLPASGILPDQALLMLAARSGAPLQDVWWQDLNSKLGRIPIGPQEIGAIGGLTKCATSGKCNFPHQAMVDMYSAALSRGDTPEVLNIYGDYALNVLGDPELSLRLWQEASVLRPNEAQYRISQAKLLTALGRYDEAAIQIGTLRQLGRFGQHRAQAEELDVQLRAARQASFSDSKTGNPQ